MNDASSSPNTVNADHELTNDGLAINWGNINDLEEKKKAIRNQKTAFLDLLIRDVDITIYAHLSALYYMEYALCFPQTKPMLTLY